MRRSNAVYTAYKAAIKDAQMQLDYDVPEHLRNAPTKLLKEMGGKNIVMRMMNLTHMLREKIIFLNLCKQHVITTLLNGAKKASLLKN